VNDCCRDTVRRILDGIDKALARDREFGFYVPGDSALAIELWSIEGAIQESGPKVESSPDERYDYDERTVGLDAAGAERGWDGATTAAEREAGPEAAEGE
jgi:hypothetical protein